MGLPKLLWQPSPNIYRGRNGHAVTAVVLHTTEDGGEDGSGPASWLCNPAAKVSAHFVVPKLCLQYPTRQLVDLADSAWAVCDYNRSTVSIEMQGFAAHFDQVSNDELDCAANITAYLLHHLGLPVRYARGGVGPGFCRHYDLGAAGGGHYDPTTVDTQWQSFVDRVTAASKVADFPAVWEHDTGTGKPCSLTAPNAATGAADPLAAVKAKWPLNDYSRVWGALEALGYHSSPVQSALLAFQRAAALVPDGIVGPLTQAAIWKALAALPAT